MKRKIYLLSLLLLAFITQVNAVDYIKNLLGDWYITGIADYVKISSVDDNQAQIPIGHYFIISKHSTQFNNHFCKSKYEFSKVNPIENLQAGYRISNSILKLPNPVLLLDTGCEFVYVINHQQIIIEKWGIFYRAIKKYS